MLKKVKPSQVRLGMYVTGFEGSWLDHPFWRSRFEISTPEQLERIRQARVDAVIIDLSKGPGPEEPTSGTHHPSATVERRPHPNPGLHSRAVDVLSTRLPLTGRERAAEVRRASRTLSRSKIAVTRLFSDARLGAVISTDEVAPLVTDIAQSVERDASIILNIARLKTKDEYTFLHSVAVCALMINLARTLNLPDAQVQELGIAGLLHDVGKMAIPDAILQKPERLNDEEFTTVRTHPEHGHAILSAAEGVNATALDVCLHHHEKMDGTGYPFRIPGDRLSLAARMGAICDVYDAITSQRPYNVPMSPAAALQTMSQWPGHFDKLLLSTFVQSLGILPAGTLVLLNSDHLAIVTGEDRPGSNAIARIFYAPFRSAPVPVRDVVIHPAERGRRIVSIEDPADWGFEDWDALKRAVLSDHERAAA
jgi:HD-GYP domain-containing protein (c-di-GMP phosphodiesterase class II)